MGNVLLEKIEPLAVNLIKDLDSDKRGSWGFTPKRPLKINEKYLHNCFNSLGEVYTSLKQLKMSSIFLTNFRATNKIKENDITRFDYCIYHIESHFFRLTGFLDRILILVNEILVLNIEHKKCKQETFLINYQNKKEGKDGKYAHLIKNRNNKLFELLINLQEYISNYRHERNIITHQGRFEDERLRKIEGLNLVLHLDKSNETQKLKYLIKNETDKKKLNNKDIMNNINIKLESIWDLLSIELVKEFFKVYDSNSR